MKKIPIFISIMLMIGCGKNPVTQEDKAEKHDIVVYTCSTSPSFIKSNRVILENTKNSDTLTSLMNIDKDGQITACSKCVDGYIAFIFRNFVCKKGDRLYITVQDEYGLTNVWHLTDFEEIKLTEDDCKSSTIFTYASECWDLYTLE
jgi:hypothetical protein